MPNPFADARFYEFLLEIDRELAGTVQARRCPCGGPLHVGDYSRSPRGGPAALPEGYEKRFSFCCGKEGCRKRSTPPSVRFFGRRWYLAPVVVLLSALRHGGTARRLATLRKWLGERGELLCRQTLERWHRWWLKVFPTTRTWSAKRDRLVLPVSVECLPQSLLERFEREQDDEEAALTALLRFVSPVTTTSCACSLMGQPRR